MKYSVYINQAGADRANLMGIVDIIDLAIFDAFKDFANSNRCEKLVDESKRVWFWIDYALVIKELPFCSITTKDGVYRRMRKLAQANLIEFHPNSQKIGKSFFSWGTNYDVMISTTETTDEKPNGLRTKIRTPTDEKPNGLRTKIRTPTDEKPNGLRTKIRTPTDEKPNDYNTNNPITITHKTKLEFPDAGAPGFTEPLRGGDFSFEAEDPASAGKASPGGGPKKNWPREMATIFDRVNEEKHRALGLPYIAFNWRIKEPENFKHLKNLKELAIIPDWKLKYGNDPNEDELGKAIEAILTRAWDYFKHIQGDKGGAIHYTPESIYRSYNTLKTFKNGNNNGIKSTRNGAGSKPAQSQFGRGIGLDSSPTAKFGY